MASRVIKKTEAGISYQIEVLSKEYKRLKRSIANQVSLFDRITESGKEDEILQEVRKLDDILAELVGVSQRLSQLIEKEKANKIQDEVEAENQNIAKVKTAVNEWLEALREYPSHKISPTKSVHNINARAQDERSFRSAPCLRKTQHHSAPNTKCIAQVDRMDLMFSDKSNLMDSSRAKEQTNWERNSFSERSYPRKSLEAKRRAAWGKSGFSERSYPMMKWNEQQRNHQHLEFEEDLMAEVEEIGKRIQHEINMIRLDISNSVVNTLQSRLDCMKDFQEQREQPATILFKIMNENQARRLAEQLAMEDHQIEEVRNIVKEVKDLERDRIRCEKSSLSQASTISSQLQQGNSRRWDTHNPVVKLRNTVRSIKEAQHRQLEEKSSRSRMSYPSALSVCSEDEDQEKHSFGQIEVGNLSNLQSEFSKAKQKLKDLKDICSKSTQLAHHRSNLLKIDNALNTMTETGRRLREHLPSIEAEEIMLEVHEEDAEVFEIKKELMKKVVRRERKDTISNSVCNTITTKKEERQIKSDKEKLNWELSTLKVRLTNQKTLINDLLTTTDTEMMRREVQNLDKLYDEYIAVAAQIRSALSVEEARVISESIADEDSKVFQLKAQAAKFIAEAKSEVSADEHQTHKAAVRKNENEDEDKDHGTENVTTELGVEGPNLLKLNELMIKTLKLQSAPKVEIEPFSGDPLEYSYFMENFKDVVENLIDNPKQRLVRLLKYTQGDAKELIKHCVHEDQENCYKEALRLLEKDYGDPLRMACAYLEKLKNWPHVKANDVVALKGLYRFLLRCLAFQKKGNIDLDSPLTIRCVQLVLPINMQDAWTAKASKWRNKNKQEATFTDFTQFIDEWCQRLSDPVYARGKSKEVKTLKTEVKEVKGAKEECQFCSQHHDLDDCPTFATKTAREKKEFLFRAKMCFCCYGRNHTAKKCENKRTCKSCGSEHPSALHGVTFKVLAVQQRRGNATCIVPVRLRHEGWENKEIEVYALLDECSDGTFISESILHEFEDNIKRNTTVEVDTINLRNEIETVALKNLVVKGSIEMESAYGVHEIKLPEVFAQERIPMNKEDVLKVADIEGWAYLKDVARTLPAEKDIPFGLLIGNNCPKALEPVEVIASKEGGPYATRSRLGWYVSAPREEEKCKLFKCSNIKVVENKVKDTSISNALQEMWREDFIEKAGEKKALSKEDRLFLEEMKRSVRMKDGHYELPLPLRKKECSTETDPSRHSISKENLIRTAHSETQEKSSSTAGNDETKTKTRGDLTPKVKIISPVKEGEVSPKLFSYVEMPDNREQILHRLKYTRKRMGKDMKFKEDYCSFMRKIIEAGYAKKVPKERLKQRGWYIPHHGVYHPRNKKFRVVLDCSAEKDGISLNSVLLQGPDFTNSLLGILLNFRKGKIPVMADIEKMYYQVLIPEEHRKFLRFFWWEGDDMNMEPTEYEMCVHPFGAISSKSCVTFALHQTAFDNEHNFGQDAMETLLKEFYIDDMLKSLEEEEDAIKKTRSIINMCKAGGFNLTKFVSTNAEVTSSIPLEKRASNPEMHAFERTQSIESALGMQWYMMGDSFGIKVTFETDDATRRGCLSTLSRIHDPIGLAAPFLLPGKKILQKITDTPTGWDDLLPPDALKEWESWREEVLLLNDVRIKRCYRSKDFGIMKDITLHCFSDASFVGYGVACYIRMTDEKGKVEVRLIMGKSRVSPLKPTTVPRLELTAATVSVKIAAMLVEELDIPEMKVYFWIDNKVVLGYIYNERRRFRIFVANRVQIIDQYSNKEQWRYVDTKENPSDLASRGASPRDTEKLDIWLNGPYFLRENNEWWKNAQTDVEIKEDDKEVKKELKVNAIQVKEHSVLETLEERISSWNKMKRVIVWIHRYASKEWRQHRKEEMTVEEIQAAEIRIIKLMQQRAYKKEIADIKAGKKLKKGMEKLRKLNPFLDDKELLRVGGRLTNAQDDDAAKFPVIVPKGAKATKAMIAWHHAQIEHRGKHSTISRIRDFGFWIISVSKEVGAIVHKCVRCRWLRGKFGNQKMANLPFNRTVDAPPFTYCGVDVFGPILVKEGRKVLKRYGMLFTCFSLRAVHVELIASLETDSFIQALRRLIARRGAVREIRSDNGTNFVGAESELLKAYEEMDHKKIGDFLTMQGCDYIKLERNTPHASHMGGVWERQIRTVKSVISSLIKSNPRKLDEESLRTFLTEAEGIVNSRPLTLENLHDPESRPLCPNQILTMKTRVAPPPPGVFQQEGAYARKRWRVVQHLVNTFWSRWRKEYLQLQQSRQKWTETKRNLKVNDIVLIKEESAPRGEWPMARVVEAHASKDGLVRSVSVFAKGKIYKRPIHKTVLLMAEEEPKEKTPQTPHPKTQSNNPGDNGNPAL